MQPLLYFLIGASVGALVGWVLRGRRAPSGDQRIEAELREQLRSRDGELSKLREALSAATNLRAAAETSRQSAEKSAEVAEQKRSELERELTLQRERQAQVNAQLATSQAQLDAERKIIASLHATFAEERKLHEGATAA